ncbi:MAG: hypothetical protein LBU56_01275 [Rickettsiales bacterium]|nr:hypothetical protein [Rickettsiales bacterium]
MSDKGNSLGSYFKQRLQNQIQTMREYSEVLHVTSAIGNDFADIINLSGEFFYVSVQKSADLGNR